MDGPRERLERAQAAARRLGRSSPEQRPDALAGVARALYRRRAGAAAAGAKAPRPAHPPAGPDVPDEQQATLGNLRAELAEELAKLATRREPPAQR